MRFIWPVLSFAAAVLFAVIGALVSEEIRTRLDRVPFAILRAASRRLPADVRTEQHGDAWLPELHYILRRDEAVPITRLIHGTRYAASLWLAAPRIGRQLGAGRAGIFRRIRQWPLWAVPAFLRAYVIAVQTAAAVAVAVAVVSAKWHAKDLLMFAGIVAGGVIGVQAIRDVVVLRRGTLGRDGQDVWFVAAAALLGPVYALLIPMVLVFVLQRQIPGPVTHRRVFSAATCGLAYAGAAVLFDSLPAGIVGPGPGHGIHIVTWTAALAICGALGLEVNNAFILGAIRLSDPAARLREFGWSRHAMCADLAQIVCSLAIVVPVAINAFLLPVTIPIVLIQRGLAKQDRSASMQILPP